MRKRKLLSIVLSLALVFSMTTAFTIAVSADDQKNGKTEDWHAPENIKICGLELTDGKYYYNGVDGAVGTVGTSTPTSGGYAYYKVENGIGTLTLHDLSIMNFNGNNSIWDAIKVSPNSANYKKYDQTLYIVLEGENYIGLDSDNGSAAVSAIGDNFIDISATEGASLTTNAYILADLGIQINSGDINIKKGSKDCNAGLMTFGLWNGYDGVNANNFGDIIIKGGDIDITGDFGCGIRSSFCTKIVGGDVYIEAGKEDPACKEVVPACEGNISGYGICAGDTVNISGGKVEIKGFDRDGIISLRESINIKGGDIDITSKSKPYTYECTNNDNSEWYYIKDEWSADYNCWIYSGTGLFATKSLNIDGGDIKISTPSGNYVGTYGAIAFCGDLNITGGSIDVSGYSTGLSSYYNVVIDNANVKIKALNDGVYGLEGSTSINNSDVEILSESTVYNYHAFWRAPIVKGNPIVYAGSDNKTFEKVTSSTDLSLYQYVHIFKEQKSFFGTIGALFSNIISWISGFKTGTFLSNSFIWKLCSAFKFF